MIKKSSFHPMVLLVYFVGVFIFVMFSQSLFVTFAAFICGNFVLLLSIKFREYLKSFAGYFILIVVMAGINPLFSHRGVTQLFFVNDIPFALESIVYGVYLGTSVANCIIWLRLLSLSISRGNVMYLFGKFAPQTALTVSMSMGFLPKIKKKFSSLNFAQRGNGVFVCESKSDKIKFSSAIFTALFGWSIESSVSTSMSMKARGYGISKRTCAIKNAFRKKDFTALVIVIFALIFCFALLGLSYFSTEFYPQIYNENSSIYLKAFVILFLSMPFILKLKEYVKWKFYLSKI